MGLLASLPGPATKRATDMACVAFIENERESADADAERDRRYTSCHLPVTLVSLSLKLMN